MKPFRAGIARMGRAAMVCSVLGASIVSAQQANANGLETPESGAIGLGRAGAVVARGSDPSSLISNPAALLSVPGFQISVSGNIALLEQCFQRTDANGNPDRYPNPFTDGTSVSNNGTVFADDAYFGQTIPKVCKEPNANVTPYLAASWRVNPWLAFTLGFYGPHTTGANQNFADRVTLNVNNMNILAPSPARYLIFRKSLLLVHPSLGVAIAPVPWLRIGAVAQPSFAIFKLGTMVNTNNSAAQSPETDVDLTLNAGGFLMAGTFGLQVLPTRWLSFGASFHVNSGATLTGTVDAVAKPFASAPAATNGMCDATTGPCPSQFSIDAMKINLPWTLRLGARFAVPRGGFGGPLAREVEAPPAQLGEAPSKTPRKMRGDDPMRDEILDLEVDFIYERTSAMSQIDVAFSGRINAGGLEVNAPSEISLRSEQRDAMGVHIGSDWNIVPGVFTLRGGVAYQTGSQSPARAQIHLPSYDSTSLHVGMSLRVPYVQLNMGYGHFFFADFRALNGTSAVVAAPAALVCPSAQSGDGACAVNRGIFSGSLDVISATATMMFN